MHLLAHVDREHYLRGGVGRKDKRRDRPYIGPDMWNQGLQSTGFTGIEVIRYDFDAPYQFSNQNHDAYAQFNNQVIYFIADCQPAVSRYLGEYCSF